MQQPPQYSQPMMQYPPMYVPQPILSTPVVIPKQSGIFKEFVTEALLHEEKLKGREATGELAVERERTRTLMQAVSDRDQALAERDRELTKARLELDASKSEVAQMKVNNELYRKENEELIKVIDVKDMKVQELLELNQTIENDNIHKRALLNEKQEFFKRQFTNSLLENQKKMYEDQLENMKQEVIMLRQQAEQERNHKPEVSSSLIPTDQPLQSLPAKQMNKEERDAIELENLKLKDMLYKKELFSKRDGKREAEVEELLLRGYAKENQRLRSELIEERNKPRPGQSTLRSDNAFREGVFRFEEEDKLKETVKRLQDELMLQDDRYRSREMSNKQKLDAYDEMDNEVKQAKNLMQQLQKTLSAKDEEINFLNTKFGTFTARYEENYRLAMEDKEKSKKEFTTKMAETNRIRDDNIRLRKEVTEARNVISEREKELDKLKKDNQVVELQKKIKIMTKKIKDLETGQKISTSKDVIKPGTPVNRQPVGSGFEDLPQALQSIRNDPNPTGEVRNIILELANRFSGGAQPRSNITVPITKNVNILESNIPLPVVDTEEVIFGITPEDDEPVREVRPNINQPKPSNSNQIDFRTVQFLRSILTCLPPNHPLTQLEHLWQEVLEYYNRKDLQNIKNPLIRVREALMSLELNIGQEAVLSSINSCIFCFNRGDNLGLSGAIEETNMVLYSILLTRVPRILSPGSLDTMGERSLKAEFDKLRVEKEQLESTIKKMPVAPRDVDFAILQRKIDMLEQQEKMRKLETVENLKYLMNRGGSQAEWQKEREKLLEIIKVKNREITRFRQEIDDLLLKLKELKASA